MNALDVATAEAVDRLRRSKDGQVFAAYLQKTLNETQGRLLEDNDDARWRGYVGEARVLKVLVEKWNPPGSNTTGSD